MTTNNKLCSGANGGVSSALPLPARIHPVDAQTYMSFNNSLLVPVFLGLVLLTGCFPNSDNVLARAPSTWSSRDCLTVMADATRNNFKDDGSPNIKIVATMLAPSVIIAAHRRGVISHRMGAGKTLSLTPKAELTDNLADSDYVASIDILLQEESGIYFDWQKGRYVDPRGNYVENFTQIDSLTFFISLVNTGWPLYFPDISNLEEEIFLLNDQNKFIRPITVWGRAQDMLMRPENLVIKFHIGKEGYHFLERSDDIRLIITGFENKISLDFPTALLR